MARRILPALLVGAFSVWAPAAPADETADRIREGLSRYEAGDLRTAAVLLGKAASEIEQALAARLEALFPLPLEGWTAEPVSSGAAPEALLGGGAAASRRYAKGKGGPTVDVELVADSPLAESVLAFLADPARASASAAVVDVNGRKAAQRLAPAEQAAEVTLVLGSRVLVSVRGRGVKGAAEVLAYARAVDAAAVERALSR